MNIEEAVDQIFTVVGGGRYKRTLEHDSLVLDTYANTYYWNSRGIGGDTADFMIKFLGLSPSFSHRIAEPSIEIKRIVKKLNPDLADMYWRMGKRKRSFWYARGYTDEVIDTYKLGYSGKYYTIPFILEGNLDAILLRGEYSKWIGEVEGSQLSLFGYDQIEGDTVLVTESALDVPILRQAGFDAIGRMYGNQVWKNNWNGLLQKYRVFVIPDNDSAGYTVINKLQISCNVCVWPKNTPKGFDCNKLYLNNPKKFASNIMWLLDNSVPIEFMKGRHD